MTTIIASSSICIKFLLSMLLYSQSVETKLSCDGKLCKLFIAKSYTIIFTTAEAE